MNDFLFMLTATLKLVPDTTTSAQSSDMDSSELTNSSNDSDRTLVNSSDAYSCSSQQSITCLNALVFEITIYLQ